MDFEQEFLGNRLYVILPAYLFSLLPWTVVQAFDYISPKWRRVKKLRAVGRIQCVTICMGICIISPYIYLQFQACDYKEACTATVAAVVALWQLSKNLWGLWQLHEFKSWAASAIRILQSHGVFYDLQNLTDEEQNFTKTLDDHQLSEYLADRIEINNAIVDNEFRHGDTVCKVYMIKGDLLEKLVEDFYRKECPVWKKVWNVLWIALNFFPLLFRPKQFSKKMFKVRQKPVHPAEVWIKWAITFSAQGLCDWIENSDIISETKTEYSAFDVRQAMYARELMATACLLVPQYELLNEPNGENRDQSMPGDKLTSLFDDTGKLCLKHMLTTALKCGKNLPFDTPILIKAKKSGFKRFYRSMKNEGLKLFKFEVEHFANSLPAKFGYSIEKFDYKHLERLTMILNLGEVKNVNLRTKHMSCSSSSFEEVQSQSLHDLLMLQLGVFDSNSKVYSITEHVKNRSKKYFDHIPIPIPDVLERTFADNKAVLDICAVVDAWKALRSGDFIHKVLEENKNWKKDFLFKHRAKNTGESNSSNSTVDANVALEKLSLAAAFGSNDVRNQHLDQTIEFLGVSMESIRSALAKNLYNCGNGQEYQQISVWRPQIPSKNPNSWIPTKISGPFSEVIAKADDKVSFLSNRWVQVRFLYELQCDYLEKIKSGIKPDDPRGMMACMLSFTSIQFTIGIGKQSSLTSDGVGANEGFHEKDVHLNLIPVGGPQELLIHCIINGADLRARIEGHENSCVDEFEWEAWRDSFAGRLQGCREWKESHEMGAIKEYVNKLGIEKGLISKKNIEASSFERVQFWNGWLPHRARICKFEVSLESDYEKTREYIQPWFENALEQGFKDLEHTKLKGDVAALIKEQLTTLKKETKKTDSVTPSKLILIEKRKQLIRFSQAALAGHYIGLELALELLCEEMGSLFNPQRALVLLENFMNKVGRDGFHETVSDDQRETLEKKYAWIVRCTNYDEDAVCAFSRFLRNYHKMKDKKQLHNMMFMLRISFLNKKSSRVLNELVQLGKHCLNANGGVRPHGVGLSTTLGEQVGNDLWITRLLYLRNNKLFSASEHMNNVAVSHEHTGKETLLEWIISLCGNEIEKIHEVCLSILRLPHYPHDLESVSNSDKFVVHGKTWKDFLNECYEQLKEEKNNENIGGKTWKTFLNECYKQLKGKRSNGNIAGSAERAHTGLELTDTLTNYEHDINISLGNTARLLGNICLHKTYENEKEAIDYFGEALNWGDGKSVSRLINIIMLPTSDDNGRFAMESLLSFVHEGNFYSIRVQAIRSLAELCNKISPDKLERILRCFGDELSRNNLSNTARTEILKAMDVFDEDAECKEPIREKVRNRSRQWKKMGNSSWTALSFKMYLRCLDFLTRIRSFFQTFSDSRIQPSFVQNQARLSPEEIDNEIEHQNMC